MKSIHKIGKNMKNKYQTPKMIVVPIEDNDLICSSIDGARYECDNFCKLWHICRDRQQGKYCLDKKYS